MRYPIIDLRLLLLLVVGMLHLSVPDGAAAQACGGSPNPCLLPVATTDQKPKTDDYIGRNVPDLEAGGAYLDPWTSVTVYKLTSRTFPADSNPNCVASNPNWTHDYSEAGYEVSLPYNGSTRAVLVRQNPESGGPWWLIDFTPGVGVGNARCLAGTGMQPRVDLAFTFSNNAATPYYAYVSDGTGVRRFDIRTLSEVPGDGWPVMDADATWLHQSENDGFFVWMLGSNGSTVVGYEPSTGTRKTYTNPDINEPRIDRAGRYVGLSMNNPHNGLLVWDWVDDAITWGTSGDPGIPFAHNASLRRRWVVVDWNGSFPNEFAMFTPDVPNSGQPLGGPAPSTLVYGNGNWIQYPGDLNDQWALFAHYSSLVPPEGPAWLAPGGLVFMTPNGERRLLGHSYNTSGTYSYFTFPKLTADGHYLQFVSDMNASGRSDVFLVEVPR